MQLSDQQIIGLPVQTRSGQPLGRIAGLDVDPATHRVASYHVRTGVIKGLWHHQLMIAPEQVVELTDERMVVEDGAVKQRRGLLAKVKPAFAKATAGKPAMVERR